MIDHSVELEDSVVSDDDDNMHLSNSIIWQYGNTLILIHFLIAEIANGNRITNNSAIIVTEDNENSNRYT